MTLGYEFAPIDVSIMTHPKAFAAGVEAMGLWLWGMAYAKQHRTDGRLHRAAVLGAWGGRRNVILAKKLVEAGLWTARDDGDWDVHNFEKKSSRSSSSAERMRRLRDKRRESDAPSDADVTSPTVTSDASPVTVCSTSPSTSVSSDLDQGGAGGSPPEWFVGVIDTVTMGTGETLSAGEVWLRYRGHRHSVGKPMNRPDAEYWVTSVVVPEVRETRRRAARDRERDAKFKDHTPKYQQPTKEQSQSLQAQLARRIADDAKKGAA